MKKLGSKMLGFGMHSDSDSSSDEEYKPRKRGRPNGGAIFGKIKKGFHDTVVNPVVQTAQAQIQQVQQQSQQQIQQIQQEAQNKAFEIQKQAEREIYDPAKKDFRKSSKYVSTEDGLATDLLYKGLPVALGAAGGVTGTFLTGGPLGGMAGNYAGQMAGKRIAEKIGRENKMGTDAQRGVGTKNKSGTKITRKYITKKKGGLSSDLLHHGVPVATGAMGAMAGSMIDPEVGAFYGATLGSQAGKLGSDYLGDKIGVGLKNKQGRPKKESCNIDIDINSHNATGKSKTANGSGIKKGSKEMKEKMARLRALRKC
jgi:hypothetical protein